MVNIRVVDDASVSGITKVNKIIPEIIQRAPSVNTENFVTKNDFDAAFDRLGKQLNPESALTPEVRGMMKAVHEVADLKNALKDPTSIGIEQSITSITTGILDAALTNMTNRGQQPAAQKPLINSLAEIFTHNVSNQLPQVLAGFKEILGAERMQRGYDAGLSYVEQQQKPKNIADIALSLDENNSEHVAYYAQLLNLTDVVLAKQMLIQYKVSLYDEQQQYQQVQQQDYNQQQVDYNEQQPSEIPVYSSTDEYIETEQNLTRVNNTQDFVRQSNVKEQQVESLENKAVKISVNKKGKKIKVVESEKNNRSEDSDEDLENTVDELLNEL